MLKEEIMAVVHQFFETGNMPDEVNATTIVLIHKMTDPKRLTEFRPTSLCNVIYKVISKCLVNRLRPLLDGIITPEQCDFGPGRLITDHDFIAFECRHTVKQKMNEDSKFCAYKLDLSKAYYRVDWHFLK